MNKKVHIVPHGEVVFTDGGRLETGGNQHHVGRHDVGFLDLPSDEINTNSPLLKQLQSDTLGPYWDHDDVTETGMDNNDENSNDVDTGTMISLDDDHDTFMLPIVQPANRQSK